MRKMLPAEGLRSRVIRSAAFRLSQQYALSWTAADTHVKNLAVAHEGSTSFPVGSGLQTMQGFLPQQDLMVGSGLPQADLKT